MSECAQLLAWFERNPSLEGHLSVSHGFLSPRGLPERLPSEYEPWDEAARALPELFFSNRTQSILDALPVLCAGEEGLPDECLTRAAVVLSALAHAYWRFGAETFFVERTTQVPTALPAPILEPWREVSRRLGRVTPERPFQSFYDLFLHNYRLRPGVAPGGPALIQNIELLVPTFGGEAERIFYAAFVEMHAHVGPIVGTFCELENSIREDRPDDVAANLVSIAQCFQRAAGVWAKIGPRPGTAFFCDPLIWAKTVAILGVPPAMCPQGGTSGACAPVIYLMDALLGRRSYDTYYGQYVRNEAAPMVPRAIHDFARCVAGIGLMDYVAARQQAACGAALDDAVRSVLDAYVGPRGWLGRHASKAFSYLCVSTITGRNASVSGHERYFSRQTWERAAQNLDESRRERFAAAQGSSDRSSRCPFHRASAVPDAEPHAALAARGPEPGETAAAREAPDRLERREITRAELSRHIDVGDLWVAIDGTVHDVSEYSKLHPGGPAILFAYAGRDVSAAFWQQNLHQTAAVRALLAKWAIGRLVRVPAAEDEPANARSVYDYLLTLLRGRQAARLQYEHLLGGDPRMKLLSDEHGHLQLWCDALPAALERLAPGSFERLASSHKARSVIERAQWLSNGFDFRDVSCATLRSAMSHRCETLRTHDLRLLDHLLDLARAALERIEQGANADALLEALVRAASLEVSRYFDLMAHECDLLVRSLTESIPDRLLRLDLQQLSAAG